MIDPFAVAAAAMFRAPGSVAATYVPAVGTIIALRVIPSRPDAVAPFNGGRVVESTNLLLILRSDVPNPRRGDVVVIDGEVLALFGDPTLDLEGVTWSCAANPA